MNSLRMVGALVFVLGLQLAVHAENFAQKKDFAKDIVGRWEVTKSFDMGPPVGAMVEFSKDGKMKGSGKKDGKEFKHEGTYKVDGKKVTLNLKDGDKEMKVDLMITKLTADFLSVENDKSNVVELKRK